MPSPAALDRLATSLEAALDRAREDGFRRGFDAGYADGRRDERHGIERMGLWLRYQAHKEKGGSAMTTLNLILWRLDAAIARTWGRIRRAVLTRATRHDELDDIEDAPGLRHMVETARYDLPERSDR